MVTAKRRSPKRRLLLFALSPGMAAGLSLLRRRTGTLFAALLVMLTAGFAGAGAERAAEAWADGQAGVEVPILMYHALWKDPARAGKFVVSPAVFEEDMRYLKEHGYTTLFLSDLIAYTEGRADLPEKPVVVTFDDGHYNNLTYALPILEALNMKAVISVVGEYTLQYSEHPDPNPNYAYLSLSDISAMVESGHIEIQNHSFAMHSEQNGRKGSARKPGESAEAYERAFTEDAMRLQNLLMERCGFAPTAYTYPFGSISEESGAYLLKMGFRASLSCREKTNLITRDPGCLFHLGRYNRPSGESTAAFMERVL